MNNKWTYIVLLLALLGLAGMIYMLMDVSPNTNAIYLDNLYHQHINRATDAEINSHYYQMGRGYQSQTNNDAITQADVINNGKKLVTQVNAISLDKAIPLSQKSSKINAITQSFVDVSNIKTTKFCALFATKLPQSGCIDISKVAPSQLRHKIEESKQQLIHYRNFLLSVPAVDVTVPNPYAPMPNWQTLIQGQRKTNAQYLLLAQSGQTQQALAQLRQDFKHMRTHFDYSDNMIKRMILQHMLVEQLHMMVLLKTKYDSEQTFAMAAIEPLTEHETNLKQIYAYELQAHKYMFNRTLADDLSWWQTILQRFIFKPQQTINVYANYYQNLIDEDAIQANEFALVQQNKDCTLKKALPLTGFGINNQGGKILANMAVLDYSQYK